MMFIDREIAFVWMFISSLPFLGFFCITFAGCKQVVTCRIGLDFVHLASLMAVSHGANIHGLPQACGEKLILYPNLVDLALSGCSTFFHVFSLSIDVTALALFRVQSRSPGSRIETSNLALCARCGFSGASFCRFHWNA